MKQSRIDRAVARATGETFRTVHRMGFGLVDPTADLDDFDELPMPLTVDWDRLHASRPGYLPQRTRCRQSA